MAIEATCPHGHSTRWDDSLAGRTVACPTCDCSLRIPLASPESGSETPEKSLDDGTRTPRGLWEIIERAGTRGDSTAQHDQPSDQQPIEPDRPASANEPTNRLKSLWELMEKPDTPPRPSEPATIEPPDQFPSDSDEGESTDSAAAVPGMLEPAPAPSRLTRPDVAPSHPVPPDAPDHAVGPPPSMAETVISDETSGETIVPTYTSPVLERARRSRSGHSPSALCSFWLGLASVPCSALALIPKVWTPLPATGLGFCALAMGLMAAGEIRRSPRRNTGMLLAIAGMFLGILSMFLGPALFMGHPD